MVLTMLFIILVIFSILLLLSHFFFRTTCACYACLRIFLFVGPPIYLFTVCVGLCLYFGSSHIHSLKIIRIRTDTSCWDAASLCASIWTISIRRVHRFTFSNMEYGINWMTCALCVNAPHACRSVATHKSLTPSEWTFVSCRCDILQNRLILIEYVCLAYMGSMFNFIILSNPLCDMCMMISPSIVWASDHHLLVRYLDFVENRTKFIESG